MRRLALLGCWLLLGGSAVRGETTSTDLTPPQKVQARALLQQLSARSFKVREQATQQLYRLGQPAKKVLEEGVRHPDAEVRRRCGRLLELVSRSETEIALSDFLGNKNSALLMKLPAWDRFSKLVGKDDPARRLFVEMYCSEGTMLAELDRRPQEFAPRFQAHVLDIQRNLHTPFGQANPISHARVVALLFMATDPRAGDNLQSFYALNNLFYQQNVQQAFKGNAGSRKLLVSFLESRSNPATVSQAFYIAQQLQLKEALPLAVKTINAKTAPPYTRGMAVLFVGRMGAKEYARNLEPLLADPSAMGTIRTGTGTINAQMRDVALAALIELSGQNIHDYNFPYMQNYKGYRGTINLPPYYYGFGDDAARAAALKKWQDSQPARKK